MELITQDNEIIKQEPQQTEIAKSLDKEWLDEDFIASTLKHIVLNAKIADNKWNLHEDFKTKLSAINSIHKMKTWARDWMNVNVAFFQPPNSIKY